ncbi:hypothetical protein SMG44B_40136 [Stenotrophomonas maltophilia]
MPYHLSGPPEAGLSFGTASALPMAVMIARLPHDGEHCNRIQLPILPCKRFHVALSDDRCAPICVGG